MQPLTPPSSAASHTVAPVFVLPLRVDDVDVDALEHVNNIAYLRWVQDVAVAHSAAVGLDFSAYSKLGAIFVVRRHEIDYLRPALRGEQLEVRTWIDSVFAAKCKRATWIVRPSEPEVVLAKALTTWGFIELASGRPTRIPDSVRLAFAQPAMRGCEERPVARAAPATSASYK